MSLGQVVLKAGRERSVLRRHPWIFTGAVASVEGPVEDGDLVDVLDARGRWLARGYLNRRSQILVRILTWEDEAIDERWWARRLSAALHRRDGVAERGKTDAYRLVYAEADGVPGLVVDRYGEYLVLQALTLGIEQRKMMLARLLADMTSCRGIYERSDVEVREKEGLALTSGVLLGEEPPERVVITEGGYRFWVDLRRGQKTGFYLDQRENRRRAAQYAEGREVLNAFSYTGAFGVYMAGSGAGSVTHLDSSAEALALAEENLRLNGFLDRGDRFEEGDVFQILRSYRDQGRSFDLVVLDPPKFAYSKAQVNRAARAYKDINLLAIKLLCPGGILVTFSCSGSIDPRLFQQIVFGASLDAGREARILEWLAQGEDHPVLLTFPESAYLKGLICRVD